MKRIYQQRGLVSVGLMVGILWVGGCNKDKYTLSRDELMNPEACAECHPSHYDEWRGSMHAYAAEDPVFIAMNNRGQRETNGALGGFCINCHAPLAVALGKTTDGLNLDSLPNHLKGITCYYCHNVKSIEGDHNNPIVLGHDRIMRGGISDPMKTEAHASRYSPHLDGDSLKSAELCGSCHDIVTPANVHLERTFAEWRETIYSKEETQPALSCAACHYAGRTEAVADVPSAPIRRRHSHMAVGLDVALTEFPFRQEQLEEIQKNLDSALDALLCVSFDELATDIVVTLENIAAGHKWPSGASADRRAWVEVVAKKDGEIIFDSGVIKEGDAVSENEGPDMWSFRDWLFDADGNHTHMFWEVQSYESQVLPAPTALSATDPNYTKTHVSRTFHLDGVAPDEVSMRIHLRPIGLDVIDDLIESGDLDSAIRAKIPTFTLGATELVWKSSDGVACVPQ